MITRRSIFILTAGLIILISVFLLKFYLSELRGIGPAVSTSVGDIAGSKKDVSDLIHVMTPKNNETVKNPLVVSGEARGYWYFEASFPVKLLDANGVEIAVRPAQAKGDWMTENFVPFEVSLEFQKPSTAGGFLVLQKDNPSGLPENDRELRIPVRF